MSGLAFKEWIEEERASELEVCEARLAKRNAAIKADVEEMVSLKAEKEVMELRLKQ